MEEGSGSSLNQSVVNKILCPSKNNRKRDFEFIEDQDGQGLILQEFSGMPSTGENGQPSGENLRLQLVHQGHSESLEVLEEAEKVGKGVQKLAQRASSEDIRNFIGNIYLGDGNCIGNEFTSPSISHLGMLDAIIKETIFQLSNFHRLFFTKFRTHSIITRRLVEVINYRIDECEWYLVPTLAALQKWSHKMFGFLKTILPPVHPDLIQIFKFQQQIGPESEVLKNLIYRGQLISNTLRARLLENGDYWNLEAHINSTYGRFSKSRSVIFQTLNQADKAKLQADLNALCLDPDHTYFYHEFAILASVRYGVELLKKDGLSAINTLDEIQIMQEYLTSKCKDMLKSLRKLSELPQVKMDLNQLKEGLEAITDLERGCSPLDLSKFLGDNAIEYIKKKVRTPIVEQAAVQDWITMIRNFYLEYSMKYTKHTPLIRHQVQCSTTGTNKNCLLLIDVPAVHPDLQQPGPHQHGKTGKARLQRHQERPRDSSRLHFLRKAFQSLVYRLQNQRKANLHCL